MILIYMAFRHVETLFVQGNIFVLNHHSKKVNNSLAIVNLFAVMNQYEDITLDDYL